jgi:hypothetical protein
VINALLVRWSGGWHEVVDSASIAAYGRREAVLGLGAIQSIAELERIAGEQLARYADPRTEINADFAPAAETETPYLTFLVGDNVTVPEIDGTTAAERVLAMTVNEDDNGTVTYAPDLKDLILIREERQEQALKKMVDGTLKGRSSVATPASYIATAAPTIAAGTAGWEAVFTHSGTLVSRYTPMVVSPIDCTLAEVQVTTRVANDDFTVTVYRDNTSLEHFDTTTSARTDLWTADTVPAVPASTSTADSTTWHLGFSNTNTTVIDVTVALRFTA